MNLLAALVLSAGLHASPAQPADEAQATALAQPSSATHVRMARGKKGSRRVGGSGPHGKGSKYER